MFYLSYLYLTSVALCCGCLQECHRVLVFQSICSNRKGEEVFRDIRVLGDLPCIANFSGMEFVERGNKFSQKIAQIK